jgi:hypothetical protein
VNTDRNEISKLFNINKENKYKNYSICKSNFYTKSTENKMKNIFLPESQNSDIDFINSIFTPRKQEINNRALKLPELKIREITNNMEKINWMVTFMKNYSGEKAELHPEMFGEISRYFVGSIEGKDVGFIRITNYTKRFKEHYSGQVWSASDAYVENSYRSQSVLRQLMNYVISNCQVKLIRIETSRLEKYYEYYYSLGFTFSRMVDSGYISISMTEDLKEPFIKIARRKK